MTADLAADSAVPAAGGELSPLGPPEDRGRTDIADRVLEKIAARAVTEMDEAGGLGRRVLPGVKVPGDSRPRAVARTENGAVTVTLEISVTYPAPVRKVTRELREQISTRIAFMTGLTVRAVDINVPRLLLAPPPQKRRVQ